MKRWAQGFAVFVFAAFAAWFGWRQYERHWLHEPIAALTAPATFEVPAGAPLGAVARALEAEGILDRPRTWLRHAKSEGLATRIQAGEYRLEPGTTPVSLLDQFVAGDVVLHALKAGRFARRSPPSTRIPTYARSSRGRPMPSCDRVSACATSTRRGSSFRTPTGFRAGRAISRSCARRTRASSASSQPRGVRARRDCRSIRPTRP
jgi:hypothetical protein